MRLSSDRILYFRRVKGCVSNVRKLDYAVFQEGLFSPDHASPPPNVEQEEARDGPYAPIVIVANDLRLYAGKRVADASCISLPHRELQQPN